MIMFKTIILILFQIICISANLPAIINTKFTSSVAKAAASPQPPTSTSVFNDEVRIAATQESLLSSVAATTLTENKATATGLASENKRLRRSSSSNDLLTESLNLNLKPRRDILSSVCDSNDDCNIEEKNVMAKMKITPKRMNDYNKIKSEAFWNYFKDLLKSQKSYDRKSPLSTEYSSARLWNSVNLSGHRQLPLYVEEPNYFFVQRDINSPSKFLESFDEFIPPRGRRSFKDDEVEQLYTKRDGTYNLDTLFGSRDTFIPNRGKKNRDSIKKSEIDDLFGNGELFFPNRGKKSIENDLFNSDLFYPNRGKKSFPIADLDQFLVQSMDSTGVKRNQFNNILQSGDYFIPNRGKKTNIDKFLTDADLFFPNRGKREHYKRNKREVKVTAKTRDIQNKIVNSKGMKMENHNIYENRSRRDLLENLVQDNLDMFSSFRGRGMPTPVALISDDHLKQDYQKMPKQPSDGITNTWNSDDLFDLIKIIHNDYYSDNYRQPVLLQTTND